LSSGLDPGFESYTDLHEISCTEGWTLSVITGDGCQSTIDNTWPHPLSTID